MGVSSNAKVDTGSAEGSRKSMRTTTRITHGRFIVGANQASFYRQEVGGSIGSTSVSLVPM